MVSFRIAETYDLSTTPNKIGLIGVHTPPRALLERHYGGLMNNYKYVRFTGCDVYFACSAQLPADPNGVGVGAGQVNPSDMMNPVLYKAVSNDYFETVVSRIYGGYDVSSSTDGGSITMVEGLTPSSDPPVGMSDFFIYYGMLSNSKGWKKAMPQSGFEMHKLQPLMYSVLVNYGNTGVIGGNSFGLHPVIGREDGTVGVIDGGGNAPSSSSNAGMAVQRGRPALAPPVPLWRGIEGTPIAPVPSNFPKTYVGAIIVPPCHLGGSRLYYRLRIVWHVEMIGLTSHQAFSTFLEMNNNGLASYYNRYYSDIPTSKDTPMDEERDMVSTNGMNIEKIMEGSR